MTLLTLVPMFSFRHLSFCLHVISRIRNMCALFMKSVWSEEFHRYQQWSRAMEGRTTLQVNLTFSYTAVGMLEFRAPSLATVSNTHFCLYLLSHWDFWLPFFLSEHGNRSTGLWKWRNLTCKQVDETEKATQRLCCLLRLLEAYRPTFYKLLL